jgi:hypothetical protein
MTIHKLNQTTLQFKYVSNGEQKPQDYEETTQTPNQVEKPKNQISLAKAAILSGLVGFSTAAIMKTTQVQPLEKKIDSMEFANRLYLKQTGNSIMNKFMFSVPAYDSEDSYSFVISGSDKGKISEEEIQSSLGLDYYITLVDATIKNPEFKSINGIKVIIKRYPNEIDIERYNKASFLK